MSSRKTLFTKYLTHKSSSPDVCITQSKNTLDFIHNHNIRNRFSVTIPYFNHLTSRRSFTYQAIRDLSSLLFAIRATNTIKPYQPKLKTLSCSTLHLYMFHQASQYQSIFSVPVLFFSARFHCFRSSLVKNVDSANSVRKIENDFRIS